MRKLMKNENYNKSKKACSSIFPLNDSVHYFQILYDDLKLHCLGKRPYCIGEVTRLEFARTLLCCIR